MSKLDSLDRKWTLVLAIAAAVSLAGQAQAADALTFGTNWKAQAEHGGFYQAVATGLYRDKGLDVTIRQGGPQVNHSQLLAAGRFALAAFQGTGFDIYYVMSGIMIISFGWVMLRSPDFGRLPGWLAIGSGGLMLVPATAGQVGTYLSLASLLPWFALLFMLWRRLWHLGREQVLHLAPAQ